MSKIELDTPSLLLSTKTLLLSVFVSPLLLSFPAALRETIAAPSGKQTTSWQIGSR
jgi:hypothetical protein